MLGAFLRLGLTSFGGPVAHLGYFRREFVERRRWLGEADYADLVAMAQILPGPASSQVGFALGLRRAGAAGGLAAWAGFTLPSVILMALFATTAAHLAAAPLGQGVAHGLKLAALAVVTQAVVGMARSLCPSPAHAVIAMLAAVLCLAATAMAGQLSAIGLGAAAGLALLRAAPQAGEPPRPALSRRPAAACILLFASLLAATPLLSQMGGGGALFSAFYQAGALVFGGGHVVAPLLDAAVVAPGWISRDAFLQGYGAAQAMPGPLFSFAAYLGQTIAGPGGAVLATVAIFLPGLLLMTAALPVWRLLSRHARLRGAVAGVNAAVVGVLAAALYDPLFVGGVRGPADLAVAVAAFGLLTMLKTPPIAVVAACALAGAALAAI